VIFICNTKAGSCRPRIFRLCGPRNHGGFTLIELIVVMSLIGIIFFFAIPRLDRSFFTNSSRQVSNWISLHVKSLKSNAVAGQTPYVMRIDMGENKISCFSEPGNNMDALPKTNGPAETVGEKNPEDEAAFDEVSEKPKTDDFSMPDGYRVSDILFVDGTVQTTGTVDIHFYPKGYSDRAIIHVKDRDGNIVSYIIEPFLSRAIIKNDYVEY